MPVKSNALTTDARYCIIDVEMPTSSVGVERIISVFRFSHRLEEWWKQESREKVSLYILTD